MSVDAALAGLVGAGIGAVTGLLGATVSEWGAGRRFRLQLAADREGRIFDDRRRAHLTFVNEWRAVYDQYTPSRRNPVVDEDPRAEDFESLRSALFVLSIYSAEEEAAADYAYSTLVQWLQSRGTDHAEVMTAWTDFKILIRRLSR